MKKYYMALFEIENEMSDESQGICVVNAMNQLRAAVAVVGKLKYYEVAHEEQYRKAEREISRGLKR